MHGARASHEDHEVMKFTKSSLWSSFLRDLGEVAVARSR
jgi:hypothetical protein